MEKEKKKEKTNNAAIKQHMVAVISLLANAELEAVYIGGTAEAAETESGAVCFHPSDKFGILLPRV